MATQEWYTQYKWYDYARPGLDINTFCFTQVVWKSSNKIGFGIATGFKDNFTCVLIVANYYPRGNVIGEFNENVLKP